MIEITCWVVALVLLGAGFVPKLRPHRSLIFASCGLALITSLLPRPGNVVGRFLFGSDSGTARLPIEVLGVAAWLLGAWILKSGFDLILRRTLFPNDDQPHARRLFADLASILVYVIAFAGIIETVMKQPLSAVLATSGVLAIVLGLALQSTLADIFSGLAINIDRPFGAGDWVTLPVDVEGQILQINWRATRLRTLLNDIVIIPNSIVARAVVTNHSQRHGTHFCALRVTVDSAVSPGKVIAALEAAVNVTASGHAVSGAKAVARSFGEAVIAYDIVFTSADCAGRYALQSELVCRAGDALIALGSPAGCAFSSIVVPRTTIATSVPPQAA